jgi:hypothetical protein
MQRRIDTVVDTLVSALNEVAKGLQLTPPNRDEFTAHVRNMPRFDAPTVDVRLGSSLAMLGLRIAEMKIRGNLHKNIGKPLGDALYSYSGQLETWSRNVLRDIEHQFESLADIYRGQLSTLGPQQTVSSDDIEQLQQDLASPKDGSCRR